MAPRLIHSTDRSGCCSVLRHLQVTELLRDLWVLEPWRRYWKRGQVQLWTLRTLSLQPVLSCLFSLLPEFCDDWVQFKVRWCFCRSKAAALRSASDLSKCVAAGTYTFFCPNTSAPSYLWLDAPATGSRSALGCIIGQEGPIIIFFSMWQCDGIKTQPKPAKASRIPRYASDAYIQCRVCRTLKGLGWASAVNESSCSDAVRCTTVDGCNIRTLSIQYTPWPPKS